MKKSVIIGIVAFLVASVVFSYPVFWACCFAIDLFAKVTGYTYEEANVVLFLYAQPVILTATAIIRLYVPPVPDRQQVQVVEAGRASPVQHPPYGSIKPL